MTIILPIFLKLVHTGQCCVKDFHMEFYENGVDSLVVIGARSWMDRELDRRTGGWTRFPHNMLFIYFINNA
jgi:hypothetical protein